MKKVIDRASSRGYFNHGWLKTHHTFSFANYYNPERIHFGALRVLNDDSVDPSMGFDTHPHKNMEVISIPLKGYLRHGDSVQNTKTITPGDIQVMSTGSGIYHSEYNDSKEEQLEFLQIWVFPRIENTKPEYNNFDIVFAEKAGFVTEMDTRALGMSVVTLGGGRRKATDAIDYSVGLSEIAALGTEINTDTPLAMIHANSEKSWQEAAAEVRKAMVIGETKRETSPMVYRQVSE